MDGGRPGLAWVAFDVEAVGREVVRRVVEATVGLRRVVVETADCTGGRVSSDAIARTVGPLTKAGVFSRADGYKAAEVAGRGGIVRLTVGATREGPSLGTGLVAPAVRELDTTRDAPVILGLWSVVVDGPWGDGVEARCIFSKGSSVSVICVRNQK